MPIEKLSDATPETDDAADVVEATRSIRPRHAVLGTIAALLGVAIIMMALGRLDSLARGFFRMFETPPAETAEEVVTVQAPLSTTFSFEQLEIHPDVLFAPYTAGPVIGSETGSSTASMIEEFRSLLDLYEQRQAIDDNFTVRVVDNRNNELLELFSLESERKRYENRTSLSWDWNRIDGMRRAETRRLVQKYVARGVPQPAVTVKWGRANQVLEAREREAPFIEYEVRLARYLGLSLLATEIGTVETFNDDRLVSPVGARSRYQMMPYVLRQNAVHHYTLGTAGGNRVNVFEEWHPLLTMESSFRTLAGYVHAVGHEIPGISAYHTGPGNIFMVYRMFLTEATSLFHASSTVVDAYMWAVTKGFGTVSKGSSFKDHSRGYVASAYGALRATHQLPIDTSKTMLAERVQLKAGKQLLLSELFDALRSHDEELRWGGPDNGDLSLYDRFRQLNPHIVLPKMLTAEGTSLLLPPASNMRIVSDVNNMPVRFFLPIGATKLLAEAGLDVIDEEKTFRFDHNTFGQPSPSEVTIWDRQYRDLVKDIAGFGFTPENKQRLEALGQRFRELAAANPSHYRLAQLDVIRAHQGLWRTNGFERVSATAAAAKGRLRVQGRPPTSALPGAALRPPPVPQIAP